MKGEASGAEEGVPCSGRPVDAAVMRSRPPGRRRSVMRRRERGKCGSCSRASVEMMVSKRGWCCGIE